MSSFEPALDIVADHEAMSQVASEYIAKVIKGKPDAILCLATGATPTRTYELLAEKFKRGEFTTDRLIIIKLDEWGGLAMNDSGTCETYLQMHVIAPLKIPSGHFISFESNPADPEKEVARVQEKIRALSPFDLTLLGLGVNGHVGFNEPGEAIGPVHITQLQESTLHHSMVRHSQGIRFGMTIGFDDILRSREIVMLVSGAAKAEQLRRMLKDDINPTFPATYLQKSAHAHVIADKAAAAQL
ncbi:MAG: Glucosamine-6-phosphate deaminase [Candidatus Kaiserbacteria bacterium GW2011_GWC2_52_8b]|uniref:Glucosamine-6-phosphate deaminase n=1 Tax=Candidatus Kaiserbacteria bacterium GW2011_GWC2_52_8b TaxID=1618676 RepID=A0A0G1XJC1_9BACT|nr:MAG: Glucosamine-6-phosphate deaminase [Candidatus Kaiserbacteria bacterium GW2011_GWC2_52_8b]